MELDWLRQRERGAGLAAGVASTGLDTVGRLRWLGRWGRCAVLLGEAEMKGGGADPVVPVVDLVVKKAGNREGKSDGASIRGHGVLQHGNREKKRD